MQSICVIILKMFKEVKYHRIFLFLGVFYHYSYEVDGSLQSDIEAQFRARNGTSLARSRRYLVFPEGSSFQLVFDLAYPSLDGIGFFVFGNTAGLAWELPSTPIFLDKKFHKKEEPEPTTTMLPHLEHPVEYDHGWQAPLSWNDDQKPDYHDPSGWQSKTDKFVANIDSSPVSSYNNPFATYTRKGFNPDNAPQYPVNYIKQNSNRRYSYGTNPSYFWNRRNQLRTPPSNFRSFVPRNDFLDPELYNNIHRRTRRELYTKFEELLSALTKNGKSCILKTICQVNKTPKGKGTLFEELLKIVFQVKPDDFYEDEDHYDQAANLAHDCDEMYPECEGNVFSKILSKAVSK